MRASFFNLRRIILIILISILFITMVFDKPIQAGAALPSVRVVLNYPTGSNPAKTITEFKVDSGSYKLVNNYNNNNADIAGFTQADSFKAEFISSNKVLKVSKKNADNSWTSLGVFTGPILLKANSDALNTASVDGKLYRGDIEIRVNYSGTGLNAINQLPMDSYLYGVVPAEMSASWPIEALKAQAVAARTFAQKRVGIARWVNPSRTITNLNEGFDLFNDTRSQAYNGYSGEHLRTNQAVDETAGKVIYDPNNNIISEALYHSNSGGYTEDSKNYPGWSSVSYLRGKEDPYSMGYGYSNWNYATNMDQIRTKVDPNGTLGVISDISLDKYQSGRVKHIIFKDTNGNTIEKTGIEFGNRFNKGFYTSINKESFMSRLFELAIDPNISFSVVNGSGQSSSYNGKASNLNIIDGTGKVTNLNDINNYTVQGASNKKNLDKKVDVVGNGWGHGVGMSQWGAYGMAQEGFKYYEILEFYYSGVKVPR